MTGWLPGTCSTSSWHYWRVDPYSRLLWICCELWSSYSDFRRDLGVDDTDDLLVTGDVFNIKLVFLGPRSIFKSHLGILWPSYSHFRRDLGVDDTDDLLVTGNVFNIKLALLGPRTIFKRLLGILWPSYSHFRRNLAVDDTDDRLVTGDVFNIKSALLGHRFIFKSPVGILWPSYSDFRRDLGVDDTDDLLVTGHVFRMIAKNCETHWIYGMQNISSYWEVFPEISMGGNTLVIKAGRNIKFISSAGEASNCADSE